MMNDEKMVIMLATVPLLMVRKMWLMVVMMIIG